MRAPEFWHQPGAPLATLLAPCGHLYALVHRLRHHLTAPERAPVPIVCVGNLVAGGAGKTPVALAIGSRAIARTRRVHFLSRGYRGRERGPLRVDPARHTASDVGDEALLLARVAPTWVARSRPAGARAAAAAGAELVVMDDGHQNPTLHKDLSLVVIDQGYGLGNGRVIPAGPLREPAEDGLGRADGVVLLDDGSTPSQTPVETAAGKPVLSARIVPTPEGFRFADEPVVAFAGIARPEKFFETLRNLGARLEASHPFPDHHVYAPDEIMRMVEEASRVGAHLVTTEKDHVRLSPEARPMAEALAVSVEFQDEDALDRLLEPVLGES